MAITVKATLQTNQGFKQLAKFKKDFNKLSQEWVEVGFDASQEHHKNERGKKEIVNMAELAYWLHEGTDDGRIPPRPFFERTLQQMVGKAEASKLKPKVARLFKGFKKGVDLDKHISVFLDDLGKVVRSNVKDNFGIENTIDLKENAKYTIKEKGRNDPLVGNTTGVHLKDAMLIKTSK